MPKSPRPPRPRAIRAGAAAVFASDKQDVAEEIVSELVLARATSDGEEGSVLDYLLPEPTSYSGRNVISLGIEGEMFRARPNQAQYLEFDGLSTYIDCGNPAHLKSGGGSLTIEAWVSPRASDGYRSIVSHGGQGSKSKAEVWLRIDRGKYEFGAWDGTIFGVNATTVNELGKSGAELKKAQGVVPAWDRQIRGLAEPAMSTLIMQTKPTFGPKPLPSPFPPRPQPTPQPAPQPAPPAKPELPKAEQPTFDASVLNVRAEDMDAWVHLAGVYDHATGMWSLYRNGELLASVSGKAPLAVNANWYIGAMWDEIAEGWKATRLWDGFIAEVRIWNVARTQAQIRENMDVVMPRAASNQLAALWHLTDGNPTKATDSAPRKMHGELNGQVKYHWGVNPMGELALLMRQQPDARVEEAFRAAKLSGLFDALVFPRMRRLMVETERQAARAAIADLSLETFKTFYAAGYHLTLQRDFAGRMIYTFVPTPPENVRPLCCARRMWWSRLSSASNPRSMITRSICSSRKSARSDLRVTCRRLRCGCSSWKQSASSC